LLLALSLAVLELRAPDERPREASGLTQFGFDADFAAASFAAGALAVLRPGFAVESFGEAEGGLSLARRSTLPLRDSPATAVLARDVGYFGRLLATAMRSLDAGGTRSRFGHIRSVPVRGATMTFGMSLFQATNRGARTRI
jgi:hypothetical protein